MTTRGKLVEIFQDTLAMIQENVSLRKAVESSLEAAKLYKEGEAVEGFNASGNAGETVDCLAGEAKPCDVTVTSHRTFEAAQKLAAKYPGKRIAVLNFASATNPGGGVDDGAFAQEECLCRCSTLYPVLNSEKFFRDYYRFHRKRCDSLYTDACIYVPNVIVAKSDEEEPKRLAKKDWCTVDVITCAAPNLWYNPNGMDADDLLKLHLKRGERIIQVAIANKCDVLVLGAFGCGAFRNDPAVVAEAYRELVEKYRTRFTAIEFAVYCSPHSSTNYDTFRGTIH